MSRSVLVIINPTSGSAEEDTAKKLETLFAEYDYHPEVRLTTAQGDAHDWAMHAKDDGFEQIAVVGGDGTLMEVISGMLTAEASCLPLLLLPAGTGNLLARTLHIPEDPLAALDELLDGEARALDVGYIKNKERYFVVAAGAGIDADIMQDANQGEKDRLGRSAYLLAIFRNLFKRRVHDVTLQLDDTSVRVRAHSVMVFNASELGIGTVRLGPGVTPHDGTFEVAVLRGVNVWSFVVDAWHLLAHKLRHRHAPDSYSVKRVYIDAQPPLLTQADGDVLGETPLDIEVLPHAIEVVVPQAYLDYIDPDKKKNSTNPVMNALLASSVVDILI